jgi:two-component system LytT family response regulator
MSYTTVIVDDEPVCIANLCYSLREIKDVEVIGTENNPELGVTLILEKRPDLLFLDVEMPQMSGLELLQSIQHKIDWPLHVVFYTAYDKYLLGALRASAFDYLLKPFQPEELMAVISRYLEHMKQEHRQPELEQQLSKVFPPNNAFMVATLTGFQLLKADQIGYFEYQKPVKCWKVNLADGRSFDLKRTTTAEDILHFSDSFLQISQYQVVNMSYLSGINDRECMLYPPFDQQVQLKISRKFLKELQQKMNIL